LAEWSREPFIAASPSRWELAPTARIRSTIGLTLRYFPRWVSQRGKIHPLETGDRLWGLALSLPLTAFLVVFFVLPLLFVVVFAFGGYDATYRPTGRFHLQYFADVWSSAIGTLFLRTAYVASGATLLSFVLSYPAAYYVAQLPRERREFFVMLLIIPFWTSFLLRTYALRTIFDSDGLANAILQALSLSQEPVFDTGNLASVIWAETYTFMPFMALPLYANLEKLNRAMLEASYVLGAGRLRTFLRIVLPLSMPGVLAGGLLVFIIAMGELVIPLLVGGVEGQFLVGNAIYERSGQQPGQASALGLLFMVVVFGIAYVYVRVVGRGGIRF
jgi:spermidine/putrescine transport system permease protein